MSDYRVSQLAKKLGVSENKIRAMIEAGALPSYQIPGSVRGTRIPEEAVKKLRGY